MKILLLQARDANDPMLRHELECFAERCELDVDRFDTLNMAAEEWRSDDLLEHVNAVMVGGSGDYSLVDGGFDWHQPYLALMRRVVARRVPTFASCFGLQAIVQAFGGTVEKRAAAAEVGTFRIELTAAGRAEPLFSEVADGFDAQLGHNDSASADLPANLINLASSQRAPVQAIRVVDAPVVATQFHPELSMSANIVRYRRYLHAYNPGIAEEEADAEAARIHRPSPIANRLLRRFLDDYV